MLEVICGPMFSGKTEELLRRLRRSKIAGKKILVIKPEIDNRYSSDSIVSHAGSKFQTEIYSTAEDFKSKIDYANLPDLIAIDEAQFLPKECISTVMLAAASTRVIAAGLDMDSDGVPFGPMPYLLSVAESVQKVSAICVRTDSKGDICGKNATISFRLHKRSNGMQVQVGSSDDYQARCRECWQIGKQLNE
jgi:thymidine kinase